MLRFVLGNDTLPVLPFAAPDAPDWRPSADILGRMEEHHEKRMALLRRLSVSQL